MHCCCNDGDGAATEVATPPNPPKRRARRVAAFIEWALPITTLALVPKCPGCVAAYVLLFTGIGVSIPAAAAVRWTLIVVSVAGIAYLLFRGARRALSSAVQDGHAADSHMG